MNHSEDELDRLLARGKLGGPGHDRIVQAVLAGRAREGRRWRRPALVSSGLALALAAGVALFAVPDRVRDDLRAKGPTAARPTPRLDVSCVGARLDACPVGATLLFATVGASPGGYLTAYAEPVAGGERIWYFSAEGRSPGVATSTGTEVAAEGVTVGAEHAPGEYRVRLWLTGRPVVRAAALAGAPGDVRAKAEIRLTVVRR